MKQRILNDSIFIFYYWYDKIFENFTGKYLPLKPTVHVNNFLFLNLSGSPMSFAKDKEMKNILLKKTTILPGTPSGITASSSKRKPIKQQPTCNFPEDQPIVLPGNPELKSPSILKRKRHECINGVDIRRGPRLTFSEVNDYSGVEELPPVSKRVRAAPLYTEPQFSSDSEDD